MADYTPTTEEVRQQYTREQPPHVGTVSSKSAEFDRWLAGIRAEVAEQIAQAIERRKRDMAGGYTGDAGAMLELGMDAAARIARQPYDRYTKQPL